MANDPNYLGTGWHFPPTFTEGGKFVSTSSGVEDIEQSLEILLSTRVGERVLQPRYGCNTERLLFEPLDTTLRTFMQELVKTAILYYEPRIKLLSVQLVPEPNEGRILIDVFYLVKGTNSRYNYVYPFYIEEGINLNDTP
ncbi:MAG: GPW/gp25 family protein [Bacteroidota bacterium]